MAGHNTAYLSRDSAREQRYADGLTDVQVLRMTQLTGDEMQRTLASASHHMSRLEQQMDQFDATLDAAVAEYAHQMEMARISRSLGD